MKSLDLRRAVAGEIAAMRAEYPVVVVHGGGPVIEKELVARNIKSEFKDGLRVTTPEAMHVVEMALCQLNKQLSQDVGQAIGLMGRDSHLLSAEVLDPSLGRVGRITKVNANLLKTLLGVGITPVVGCIAVGGDGNALNINADTAAGAIAGALGEGIIFLTDVDGVYRNYPDSASRASQLTRTEVEEGITAGWIASGMIPKVRAALDALDRGAPFAIIASGMNAGVLSAAAKGEAGTCIVP